MTALFVEPHLLILGVLRVAPRRHFGSDGPRLDIRLGQRSRRVLFVALRLLHLVLLDDVAVAQVVAVVGSCVIPRVEREAAFILVKGERGLLRRISWRHLIGYGLLRCGRLLL